ncbi:MAG: Mov34/MPN/PAD-1 family protein [Promethearchaeota archaeon]
MSEESSIKKDERITSKKSKIFIKMAAFRNMITHVLRFASDAMENSVEVMGICMGYYDKKKDIVVVENAIPVTHGSRVEVGFSPEDYAAFARIDEEYASKGLYAVGWYHSHPNWGLFFSDQDKKNQLFYQKEQTPYGFGIVFDHSLMGKDGNLGFEIYRLDDPSKGVASDYHKVAYEVEVPKTLDFFKWVKKFVEDSQKKSPILIKELNEMTEVAPQDLQEIPMSEEAQEGQEADEFPHITPLINGFEEGIKAFQDTFMSTFKSQLGTWSKEVSEGSIKGSEYLKNTLSQMKEALSLGFSKVKNWFERNLEEITDDFQKDISEYLNKRINAQKSLADEISVKSEEILNESKSIVEKGINDAIEGLHGIPNELNNKIEQIKQSKNNFQEIINQSSKSIGDITSGINEMVDSIKNEINESNISLGTEILNKIETIGNDLSLIKNTITKLSDLSKNLQEIIKEIRNLS